MNERENYLRWIEEYTNNQFDRDNLPGGVALALERLEELHKQNPTVTSERVGDLSRSFSTDGIPAQVVELLRPYRRLRSI